MASGPPRKAPPPPAFGARGYGMVSIDWFQASDSFKAILDQSNGVFYGGGGQAIFRHFFVDVSFEHFKKTGERAIVVDGDVFRLGIPDTITMDPVRVVGGYRFPTAEQRDAVRRRRHRLAPTFRRRRISPTPTRPPTSASPAITSWPGPSTR